MNMLPQIRLWINVKEDWMPTFFTETKVLAIGTSLGQLFSSKKNSPFKKACKLTNKIAKINKDACIAPHG